MDYNIKKYLIVGGIAIATLLSGRAAYVKFVQPKDINPPKIEFIGDSIHISDDRALEHILIIPELGDKKIDIQVRRSRLAKALGIDGLKVMDAKFELEELRGVRIEATDESGNETIKRFEYRDIKLDI